MFSTVFLSTALLMAPSVNVTTEEAPQEQTEMVKPVAAMLCDGGSCQDAEKPKEENEVTACCEQCGGDHEKLASIA